MNDLVIVGAGGVGRFVQQAVDDLNRDARQWNLLGFLDDDASQHGESLTGLPILGGLSWLDHYPATYVAIAVASPWGKHGLVRRLDQARHRRFATVIHPQAWIGSRVAIGEGMIVYPGVRINIDASIGRHVTLNMNCAIGHDAKLGDYVTCAPGVNVGGATAIGEGCDLGIGSSTTQRLAIGEWSIVGAGATVIADVPANVTVVGVPAKPIKRRVAGWHRDAVVSDVEPRKKSA